MRLNSRFNFIFFVIVAYLLIIVPEVLYGQTQENGDENSSAIKIIEQALKNYDSKKQNEQEEFKTHLNSRLDQVTKSWIADMENTRYNQLDTIIDQNWDKQPRTEILLPTKFGYYLRGYKYSIVDSDIIKTESMNPPYKAVVIVKEELYAEMTHHSNVSDIKPYLYTVTSICTLNFAYKDNDFELINTDTKIESKVNEMPSEARKEWLWHYL